MRRFPGASSYSAENGCGCQGFLHIRDIRNRFIGYFDGKCYNLFIILKDGDLMTKCPICHSSASINKATFDGKEVNCQKCGKFGISNTLCSDISVDENRMLQAILHERNLKGHRPIAIFSEDPEIEISHIRMPVVSLRRLLKDFPIQVSERLERSLVNLANLSAFPGQKVPFNSNDKSIFFPITNEDTEVFYLIQQLISEGLIEGHPGYPSEFVVTVKGWNKVAELEKTPSDNKQVFVAMWFDQQMESIYENTIEKAIKDNGFDAVRIDKVEHNNKIDDEIIANIKNSKFVIADFTGHRGGVYFEAGYAMGRGIPVIWTCREDDLENLHFDTRQYSHIVWTDEVDLYTKLNNRIKATIL